MTGCITSVGVDFDWPTDPDCVAGCILHCNIHSSIWMCFSDFGLQTIYDWICIILDCSIRYSTWVCFGWSSYIIMAGIIFLGIGSIGQSLPVAMPAGWPHIAWKFITLTPKTTLLLPKIIYYASIAFRIIGVV